MDDEKKNNVHILWHERVDEEKITELTEKFINAVFDSGFQLSEIKVAWNKGKFTAQTLGQHLKRRVSDKKPPENH